MLARAKERKMISKTQIASFSRKIIKRKVNNWSNGRQAAYFGDVLFFTDTMEVVFEEDIPNKEDALAVAFCGKKPKPAPETKADEGETKAQVDEAEKIEYWSLDVASGDWNRCPHCGEDDNYTVKAETTIGKKELVLCDRCGNYLRLP